MSTILETATAAVATLAGHGPQQRYRQSVFDNVCDPGILFDSRRIEAEWRKDRSVYEARAAACETLKVEVPRLEEAAADVAKAVTEAEVFARSVIGDNVIIGDLRQRIHAANDKLPAGTPAELAAGLAFLCNIMPGGFIGACKSRAIAARGAVESARTTAEQTLYRSAGDSAPDHAALSLQQQIEQLKARIAERRPTLEVEERIKQQRAMCEAIAAGTVAPPITPGALTLDGKSAWIKNAYHQARAKLDELMGLLAGRQDAETANAKDIAELAKLNVKLQAANESRKARMFAVENMRWAD